MILPVYLYGHPVLRRAADIVPGDYPKLAELIADMFETMYNADGVGLAAPQIGRSIRLLVIDADSISKNHPECKGFKRVMINPVIAEESDEESPDEEGCLSIPGIHEKVWRSTWVRVEYEDEQREKRTELFEAFNARVVLHEYDHLNGEVFIDHIAPIRKQLNRRKLNSIIKGTSDCTYNTVIGPAK
ncbi:MAG: peptide deformylase [Tannerellaceae bacterium]|jgi:peptide deformylase|nr:peptide deformylase [Tannerellaceae bacterium]